MSSDVDFADLVRFLSIERLATFQAITGSTGEAISLHQQTVRLGSQLMVLTAGIEVALRNAVYERLENYYGKPDWLVTPPTGLVWIPSESVKIKQAIKSARREKYAKMNQIQKRHLDMLIPGSLPAGTGKMAHQRLVALRQEQIGIPVGQIMTQLTFFFWKRLYSKDYANVLWTPLKNVFPNKRLTRAEIATQLERLYQSRNRIAHHEPIFGRRLRETLEAIEFFMNHFDGRDADGVPHISKLLGEDLERLKISAAELESRIASFKVPGGG
ncbi:hypothetical protein ACWV16_23860 [Achromobacter xylosoxidans]|uniref:hypothetical protein n=1 Tax=Alcaligenes xylosoxydans xylosoxydans TaxID=85698 RepID=UPI0006C45411|nr:hypothetical protein [Achromobacter xylosoxidans]MCH1990056.1 hypothetical protein [Achromobacter xylosoxidans]MCH1995898.1 hypothetical protein [Achromobacter xylosoxidans]MCH4587672.1 hypothetical protein [Achromobacter xylosoxidans]OFQ38955.1 hypothetical protein HMPREF2939_05200 [Achromobacter xylosoxidans]WOB73286.1 hypothetical protein PZA07_29145 [Achromobacter xylosoxidans]